MVVEDLQRTKRIASEILLKSCNDLIKIFPVSCKLKSVNIFQRYLTKSFKQLRMFLVFKEQIPLEVLLKIFSNASLRYLLIFFW